MLWHVLFHGLYAPINGLPQDGGWGGGGGKAGNPQELDSMKLTWAGNLTSWTFPGWEIWLIRHLGKWRTREWVIKGPPIVIWMSFPHFDGFISLWRKSNTCTKSHFGNWLSYYMFSPDAVLPKFLIKWKIKKSYVKTWKIPGILH